VNKYVLSFLLLLVVADVFGQQSLGQAPPLPPKKSVVSLVESETASSNTDASGKKIIKVHKGIFKQDYSTMTSDSAYFYPDKNAMDAFGHVNINQGDTLNIYSDKLNYNGNTKVAILTNHVKMIDKDATLTTDHFTYNTATRIGIYTDGGKLVNKDNTLTSKNGYYFAFTRDEYFRYNVVCTTPDALIKTDTLRYNSGDRIAYFYGPTHIYGTKDNDTLYTENGTYNTITEQAVFGKNNLYSQGTKTLTGDSLFYNRLKGYGRAVKRVVFHDSEQKAVIRGNLGEYYKADDNMVMTQNPYMMFDTDTTANKKPAIDSLLKTSKAIKADTVVSKLVVLKAQVLNKKPSPQKSTRTAVEKQPANKPTNKKMTLQGITDSVIRKAPVRSTVKSIPKNQADTSNITGRKPIKESIKETVKNNAGAKHDSLLLVADTLETRVLTYKDLKALLAKQLEWAHRDTSVKIKKTEPVVDDKPTKFITPYRPNQSVENRSLIHPEAFNKPATSVKVSPRVTKVPVPKKDKDSLTLKGPKPMSDTTRIRIVSAHHHAKMFKSDLQGKADSMFYSTADSTIRCYVNPMIWAEGSQISGDTINLQMKNKKLDNMDVFQSAFIVNIEKNDSTHFNQVSGITMHATFKNNKLNTMLVNDNAETRYFHRDTVKNVVTDMAQSTSGSIFSIFKNGEMTTTKFFQSNTSDDTPIAKVKEEDKLLKNFIWKPKERPVSKEALLAAYYKQAAVEKKEPVTKKINAKNPPALKRKTINSASAVKRQPVKPPLKPAVIIKKDSTVKDTSKGKKINSGPKNQ